MAKLRCSSCLDAFPWDVAKGFPRFCPLCGEPDDSEDNPEVAAPHVSAGMAKNRLQSANQTYRDMEDGSALRAQLAESETGDDSSGLKITNLKDNVRQGDTIAMDLPSNPVSQVMAQAPQNFGWRDASGAAGYGAAAHTGYAPHAGARTMASVTSSHPKIAPQLAAAGEKGRY